MNRLFRPHPSLTRHIKQSYTVQQKSCRLLHQDWREVQCKKISDFEITARELEHKPSGAKFLHLFRADEEVNAFSVNFRTTPKDSTGISHILEHSVLCGSKNYPVRDPFFKMLNRSLSSFMNAMTGPDYTLYPFATPNKKDFYNLMSVYLDAVFNPLLKRQDFNQEGWRLEPENLQDPNSSFMIKGVVFNEMKGVYADPQQLFNRHMLNLMLPSHTYGNCSGGIPAKIPDLTWENLRKFHAKHYSPENARFLSYGSVPLEEQLEFLQPYLPSEKSSPVADIVPPEPTWDTPRRAHITCAPDPSSPESSTLAVGFKLTDIGDSYENFVLSVIGELLIDGPSAPFYKSLLEPGLGATFSPVTGFDNHTKDTLFAVGLQGVETSNLEAVEKAIQETFLSVVQKGFEKDRIEAILHRTELSLKNKSSNNFGVNMIMGLTPLWNHNDALCPLENMEINAKVEKFRKSMESDPKYLEKMVEKFFVNNSHKLTMSMSPDPEYNEKQQKELDAIEKTLVDRLTDSDKERLTNEGKELEAAQAAIEDISALPTLKITDIKDDAKKFETDKKKISSTQIQISRQPTNGVPFFRGVLSLGRETLPESHKPYLPLFSSVVTKLGAGSLDFRKLDTEVDLRTGGLGTGIHLVEKSDDPLKLNEGFLISAHCLERNTDAMFDLWTQIFNDVHYENPERLKTLITMMATSMMNGVVYSGHRYAMGASSAGLMPGAGLRESNGGLSQLKFMSALSNSIQQSPEKLAELAPILKEIGSRILTSNNLRIALNTTPEHSADFEKATAKFLESIPNGGNAVDETIDHSSTFKASPLKEYVETPFSVHFCSKSVTIPPYADPDFAAIRVMCRLISLKFLHREIREKGGAYGGGVMADSSGVLSFYSYRDPNREKTLEAFEASHGWLSEGSNFSQTDIDEAKLGVFQKIDEPVVPGSRGMREFLSDVDYETFNEHRRRLKAVTKEDILRVGQKYLGKERPAGVTVIGPQDENLDSSWTKNSLQA